MDPSALGHPLSSRATSLAARPADCGKAPCGGSANDLRRPNAPHAAADTDDGAVARTLRENGGTNASSAWARSANEDNDINGLTASVTPRTSNSNNASDSRTSLPNNVNDSLPFSTNTDAGDGVAGRALPCIFSTQTEPYHTLSLNRPASSASAPHRRQRTPTLNPRDVASSPAARPMRAASLGNASAAVPPALRHTCTPPSVPPVVPLTAYESAKAALPRKSGSGTRTLFAARKSAATTPAEAARAAIPSTTAGSAFPHITPRDPQPPQAGKASPSSHPWTTPTPTATPAAVPTTAAGPETKEEAAPAASTAALSVTQKQQQQQRDAVVVEGRRPGERSQPPRPSAPICPQTVLMADARPAASRDHLAVAEREAEDAAPRIALAPRTPMGSNNAFDRVMVDCQSFTSIHRSFASCAGSSLAGSMYGAGFTDGFHEDQKVARNDMSHMPPFPASHSSARGLSRASSPLSRSHAASHAAAAAVVVPDDEKKRTSWPEVDEFFSFGDMGHDSFEDFFRRASPTLAPAPAVPHRPGAHSPVNNKARRSTWTAGCSSAEGHHPSSAALSSPEVAGVAMSMSFTSFFTTGVATSIAADGDGGGGRGGPHSGAPGTTGQRSIPSADLFYEDFFGFGDGASVRRSVHAGDHDAGKEADMEGRPLLDVGFISSLSGMSIAPVATMVHRYLNRLRAPENNADVSQWGFLDTAETAPGQSLLALSQRAPMPSAPTAAGTSTMFDASLNFGSIPSSAEDGALAATTASTAAEKTQMFCSASAAAALRQDADGSPSLFGLSGFTGSSVDPRNASHPHAQAHNASELRAYDGRDGEVHSRVHDEAPAGILTNRPTAAAAAATTKTVSQRQTGRSLSGGDGAAHAQSRVRGDAPTDSDRPLSTPHEGDERRAAGGPVSGTSPANAFPRFLNNANNSNNSHPDTTARHAAGGAHQGVNDDADTSSISPYGSLLGSTVLGGKDAKKGTTSGTAQQHQPLPPREEEADEGSNSFPSFLGERPPGRGHDGGSGGNTSHERNDVNSSVTMNITTTISSSPPSMFSGHHVGSSRRARDRSSSGNRSKTKSMSSGAGVSATEKKATAEQPRPWPPHAEQRNASALARPPLYAGAGRGDKEEDRRDRGPRQQKKAAAHTTGGPTREKVSVLPAEPLGISASGSSPSLTPSQKPARESGGRTGKGSSSSSGSHTGGNTKASNSTTRVSNSLAPKTHGAHGKPRSPASDSSEDASNSSSTSTSSSGGSGDSLSRASSMFSIRDSEKEDVQRQVKAIGHGGQNAKEDSTNHVSLTRGRKASKPSTNKKGGYAEEEDEGEGQRSSTFGTSAAMGTLMSASKTASRTSDRLMESTSAPGDTFGFQSATQTFLNGASHSLNLCGSGEVMERQHSAAHQQGHPNPNSNHPSLPPAAAAAAAAGSRTGPASSARPTNSSNCPYPALSSAALPRPQLTRSSPMYRPFPHRGALVAMSSSPHTMPHASSRAGSDAAAAAAMFRHHPRPQQQRQQQWARQFPSAAAGDAAAAVNEADEARQRDDWAKEFLTEEPVEDGGSSGAHRNRWYANIASTIRWVNSPQLTPDDRPLHDPTASLQR